MKTHIIENAPSYIIYEDGRIFSQRSNKFLTPYLHNNGYYIVDIINKENKRQKFYIHRLLALYFLPNDDPINKTQVNHKDENKQNNSLNNLEWIGLIDNLNYGTAQQRSTQTRCQKIDMLDKMNGQVIMTFNSAKEAAAYVNRAPGTLTPALKNPTKSCGGRYWRYHIE